MFNPRQIDQKQKKHVSSGLVGLVEQLNNEINVLDTVVSISSNAIPVIIYNSNYVQYVYEGQNIATFNSIADDDIMSSAQSEVNSIASDADDPVFDLSHIENESLKSQFRSMLKTNKAAFINKDQSLGFYDKIKHTILLKPDARFKHAAPYRYPLHTKAQIDEQINYLTFYLPVQS